MHPIKSEPSYGHSPAAVTPARDDVSAVHNAAGSFSLTHSLFFRTAGLTHNVLPQMHRIRILSSTSLTTSRMRRTPWP